ncbi:L-threonine ammonia-lyase [Pavlovales sp. CCMP2436]|nr:L-threonine ammonia-lyase [Pavlovales sp. CCMP2436]
MGNNILLKREDVHSVHSFKIRGAYNKISQLPPDALRRGVVACSAGNHAQGVALSAVSLGIDATIVMPTGTPAIKVNAVSKLLARGTPGSRIVLHGANYDEAQAEAKRIEAELGLSLIHPFDDPLVIAGQGTIGMEICKQTTGRPLDAIFVCCGGGGMLAGIAAYVKRVRPSVMVIGVEAEEAAGMTESLRAGQPVTLDSVGLFVDGAAVRTIGKETFRPPPALVDDMVTPPNDEVCAAIKDVFNDTRVIQEPAGALAVAGVKKFIERTGSRDCTFVATTSGSNIDFDRLRFVAERADSTEALISVLLPETPGALRLLYESCIHPRNVTELSYRHNGDASKQGAIFVGFQRSPMKEPHRVVVDQLVSRGYSVHDLSNNELAKAHVRYLCGGRASSLPDEVIYRFEFPERPGALLQFLSSLRPEWNISLFHYRSCGASDVGEVLVGLQVPESQRPAFIDSLDEIGYKYAPETDNVVYNLFLR